MGGTSLNFCGRLDHGRFRLVERVTGGDCNGSSVLSGGAGAKPLAKFPVCIPCSQILHRR